MASEVWGRDPQEAFENPYEYGIQEQFVREAEAVLRGLYRLLNCSRHHYTLEDRSAKKAVWLLAMDALDSLREALAALVRKEHRVAGKLFRDISESVDLATFFKDFPTQSRRFLHEWYADGIVPHREYRDAVKKKLGPDMASKLAKHYSSLSHFTHRSYHAILAGYGRGGEDRLVHDRTGELYGEATYASTLLVLPHTISSCYAILANLILEYAGKVSDLDLVDKNDVRDVFACSLETETVPRRFLPTRWLSDRLTRRSRTGPSQIG